MKRQLLDFTFFDRLVEFLFEERSVVAQEWLGQRKLLVMDRDNDHRAVVEGCFPGSTVSVIVKGDG